MYHFDHQTSYLVDQSQFHDEPLHNRIDLPRLLVPRIRQHDVFDGEDDDGGTLVRKLRVYDPRGVAQATVFILENKFNKFI